MSPDTRRGAAGGRALGYAPNSAAKNLRTLRTGKLLVTVPDISNPFFSLILQGIEDAAQREGYAVLFGDTQHDEKREERYALMLQRKEADGLIFLGHRLPKEAAALVRAWRPLRAGRQRLRVQPAAGIPSVHIDNAKAAAEAMDHLYSLGHRRIGIVTGPLVSPLSRDRLRGATSRADSSAPSATSSSCTATSRSTPARRRGTTARRARAADGDVLLQRRDGDRGDRAAPPRPRVPRDVSVVGFDDIRFSRDEPPLTTIAQPMREIGEGTVRLLLGYPESRRDRSATRINHVASHPHPGSVPPAWRPACVAGRLRTYCGSRIAECGLIGGGGLRIAESAIIRTPQ